MIRMGIQPCMRAPGPACAGLVNVFSSTGKKSAPAADRARGGLAAVQHLCHTGARPFKHQMLSQQLSAARQPHRSSPYNPSTVRIAWFSPMPPVRSGIALDSEKLVAALRARHDVDVFVDEAIAARSRDTLSAHEFVPRHRQLPYALTVYQIGNSSHHDYLWPYAFRYPGLVVLHDAHLHHARAAALLRSGRRAEYRLEFTAAHPGTDADAAELAIAGFDSNLHYMWPMARLLAGRARVTAVHSRPVAQHMTDELALPVECIRLSHGTPVSAEEERAARVRLRTRYQLDDGIVFGVFGGLSPEKRIPQILDAFAALLPYAGDATLLLAGAPAAHYDVAGDISRRGLTGRIILTGYVEEEAELTDLVAGVDVVLNLRWPTARETSGPWLRALAAGKPTVVVNLLQILDVATLDPRTWTSSVPGAPPIAVAVDLLDEEHSLRLAMRRLAADPELRRALGQAARRSWHAEHAFAAMVSDYERLFSVARQRPEPSPPLPPHLLDDGTGGLEELLAPFGLRSPLEQTG